jgi:hypothetical protein
MIQAGGWSGPLVHTGIRSQGPSRDGVTDVCPLSLPDLLHAHHHQLISYIDERRHEQLDMLAKDKALSMWDHNVKVL